MDRNGPDSGRFWALLFIPVFYSFYPRQENRSFLLQPRDRTITENGHSGTARIGAPGQGSSARLLHSDLYIRVYSAVFNIIRKCFTKELSNDEEGKKLCSELCRFL